MYHHSQITHNLGIMETIQEALPITKIFGSNGEITEKINLGFIS